MRVLQPAFLCFFLVLLCALVCGVHSAPRPGLFSVLADRALWVFDDPISLVTFTPSAVVTDLPLHQRLVSAAASSKPGGSFVLVGSQTVAVQRQARRPFELAFSFHPNITLYDATYVPTTGVLVAVGVNTSMVRAEIVFFRSEDGGFTWTSSPSPRNTSTYATRGSISFSSSGDLGLCVVGSQVFRSLDGGRSWVNLNSFSTMASAVAVLDRSLAVVTTANSRGEGLVLTSADAGTTWKPSSNAAIASSGIVLVDRQTWVVAAESGQIWRTTDGGKTWARTSAQPNTDWTGLAYNADWGALLAVGYVFNNTGGAGVMALSWDLGGQWLLSGPLDKAHMFDRVVPGTPSL